MIENGVCDGNFINTGNGTDITEKIAIIVIGYGFSDGSDYHTKEFGWDVGDCVAPGYWVSRLSRKQSILDWKWIVQLREYSCCKKECGWDGVTCETS